jgi:hypothetical protein
MPEITEKHEITFFVNNKPIVTRLRELSGAAIKQLAGIPADYELYRVRDNDSEPIADNQLVPIREDEHFRAIPAGTFGSNAVTS